VAKLATEIRVETPDKANAVLAGELALPLTDTSPDYAALQVANHLLGGSSNSRLWERIRQREGLSYGVSTSLDANSFEPNTPLVLEVIFAPQNIDRLRTALDDELKRVVRDGFSAQEVSEAKLAVLAQRRLNRLQDRTLAAALARQSHLGRSFAYSAKVDAAIAALTTDEVNTALRKYVKPEAFAYTYAGDFRRNLVR
jgi:zinc protease